MSNFDRAFIKAYDKTAESNESKRRASTRDVLMSISLRKDDGSTQRIEQPVEDPKGHVAGPHLDPISMATGQDLAMPNVPVGGGESSVIVLPTGELEPKTATDKDDAKANPPQQIPVETNETPTASRMNIDLDHIRQIRELEEERAQRARARRLAEKLAAEEAAAELAAEEKAEALRVEQRRLEQQLAEQREAEERAERQRLAEQRAAEQRAAEQRAAEQRAAEQRAAEQRAAEQRAVELRAAEQLAAEKRAAEQLAAEQRAAEQRAAEQRAAELLAAEQRAAELRAAEQHAAELRLAEQRAAEQRAAEQRAAAERLAERERLDQAALLQQQAILMSQPITTYVDSVARAEPATNHPQPIEPATIPVQTPPQPEPVGQAAQASQFEPAWEVDRITWPEISDLLLQTQLDYFAEAGDQLRDSAVDGLSVLAISSELRGEGRSTVAMCLARSAAAAGVRVALLDADFDHPTLGTQLNLSDAPGWDEVLDGRTPLSEAAVQSVEDNVCVFPLSPEAAGAGLSPSKSAVTSLIRRVAQEFELVILDAGPLGESHRVMFESGERCPIDATVLVRDTRRIAAADQEHNIRLWRAIGVQAVGAVENFLPN